MAEDRYSPQMNKKLLNILYFYSCFPIILDVLEHQQELMLLSRSLDNLPIRQLRLLSSTQVSLYVT